MYKNIFLGAPVVAVVGSVSNGSWRKDVFDPKEHNLKETFDSLRELDDGGGGLVSCRSGSSPYICEVSLSEITGKERSGSGSGSGSNDKILVFLKNQCEERSPTLDFLIDEIPDGLGGVKKRSFNIHEQVSISFSLCASTSFSNIIEVKWVDEFTTDENAGRRRLLTKMLLRDLCGKKKNDGAAIFYSNCTGGWIFFRENNPPALSQIMRNEILSLSRLEAVDIVIVPSKLRATSAAYLSRFANKLELSRYLLSEIRKIVKTWVEQPLVLSVKLVDDDTLKSSMKKFYGDCNDKKDQFFVIVVAGSYDASILDRCGTFELGSNLNVNGTKSIRDELKVQESSECMEEPFAVQINGDTEATVVILRDNPGFDEDQDYLSKKFSALSSLTSPDQCDSDDNFIEKQEFRNLAVHKKVEDKDQLSPTNTNSQSSVFDDITGYNNKLNESSVHRKGSLPFTSPVLVRSIRRQPTKAKKINLKSMSVSLFLKFLHDNRKLIDKFVYGDVLVTFNTDDNYSIYELSIRGKIEENVNMCASDLESTVARIDKCKTTSHLQNWHEKHLDAIQGSEILNNMQINSNAIACFYYQAAQAAPHGTETEKQLFVDFVSYSSDHVGALKTYILGLAPRQTEWDIPLELLPHQDHIVPYACQIQRYEIKPNKPNINDKFADGYGNTLVQVWGFDSYPEEALEGILNGDMESSSDENEGMGMKKMETDMSYLPMIPGGEDLSKYHFGDSQDKVEHKIGTDDESSNPLVSSSAIVKRVSPEMQYFRTPSSSAYNSPMYSSMSEDEGLELDLQVPSASSSSLLPYDSLHSSVFSHASSRTPSPDPLSPFVEAESLKIEDRMTLAKQYPHRMSFTFQDREAGIFYQTFELELNLFVSITYNVKIAPLELKEEQQYMNYNDKNRKQQGSGYLTGQSGFASNSRDERTRALKIEIFGSSQKEVQQAVGHLTNNLNAIKLGREQIYFPRIDAGRYRYLNKVKDNQDARLTCIRNACLAERRTHENLPQDAKIIVEPMQSTGFINIRIKPPMNAKGFKRMSFPSDCTVTVSGPVATKNQMASLKRYTSIFESIPSQYFVDEMEISSSSKFAKRITMKSTREQFIKEYGLVSLRLDEMTKKRSGCAGIAKIWANTEKSLTRVMRILKEAEKDAAKATAEAAAIQRMKCESLAASSTATGAPSFAEAAAGFFSDPPIGTLKVPTTLSLQHLTDSGSLVSNKSIGTIGSRSASPQMKTFASALSPPSAALSPPGLGSPGPRSIIIHWPHQSLRFIFLEENIKLMLNTLIMEHREQHVKITTPYRDKKDPSVCMLIESEGSRPGAVKKAAEDVRKFMNAVTKQLLFLYVAVPTPTYDNLRSRDLIQVKELQGEHGVHIVTEPIKDDFCECTHEISLQTFSLEEYKKDKAPRGPPARPQWTSAPPSAPAVDTNANTSTTPYTIWQDNCIGQGQGQVSPPTATPEKSSIISKQPLLSLRVRSMSNGHFTELWVVKDQASAGFDFGVPAVLLVLDTGADFFLKLEEKECLERGDALVTKSGNIEGSNQQTMLRVRPRAGCLGPAAQRQALSAAIVGGLRTADRMFLNGIAIVVPTFNSTLPELAPKDVQEEVSRAILRTLRQENISNINKIVCMDNTEGADSSEIAERESALHPTAEAFRISQGTGADTDSGNRQSEVALTLVKQWNEEQCPKLHNTLSHPSFSLSSGKSKSIELLQCNMALPPSLQLAMPERPQKASHGHGLSLGANQMSAMSALPFNINTFNTGTGTGGSTSTTKENPNINMAPDIAISLADLSRIEGFVPKKTSRTKAIVLKGLPANVLNVVNDIYRDRME